MLVQVVDALQTTDINRQQTEFQIYRQTGIFQWSIWVQDLFPEVAKIVGIHGYLKSNSKYVWFDPHLSQKAFFGILFYVTFIFRQAYLRKHQTSHQPVCNQEKDSYHLDNSQIHPSQPDQVYYNQFRKDFVYSDFEKRRLQTLNDFYMQQKERFSAFQYVRHNHYDDYFKRY